MCCALHGLMLHVRRNLNANHTEASDAFASLCDVNLDTFFQFHFSAPNNVLTCCKSEFSKSFLYPYLYAKTVYKVQINWIFFFFRFKKKMKMFGEPERVHVYFRGHLATVS